MNYQKIYHDICKRGQERELPKEIYTEKHHIVPKCLDGGNEKENITKLTAREHFLVHYILAAKIYKNHKGLWNAFRKMLYVKRDYQERYVPSGRFYEQLKIELNNSCKGIGNHFFGKTHTDENKTKASERMKGKYVGEKSPKFGKEVSKETRELISNANTGKIRSDEFKQLKSKQMTGEGNHFYGRTHSEEVKLVIREKRKLQIFTKETRQKMSESRIGEGNNFYGKQHSEISKEKIRNNRPNAKPCSIVGMLFASANDASRKLNIPAQHIRKRCLSDKEEWQDWKFILTTTEGSKN